MPMMSSHARKLPMFRVRERRLVDQNSASWNPVSSWLRQIAALRAGSAHGSNAALLQRVRRATDDAEHPGVIKLGSPNNKKN
jgi:hypothetical protein